MVGLLLLSLITGVVFYTQQRVALALAMAAGRRSGLRAALAVLGGALAGDAVWAAAAVLLFSLAQGIEAVRVIFSIVGSFFLLRLAWGALMDARQGVTPRQDLPDAPRGFRDGAAISFRNPYALGFWLGAAAAIILLMTRTPGPFDALVFLAGSMLGAGGWCLLFGWLAATRPATLSTGFFRAINTLSGLFAAVVGVAVLWATVTQPTMAARAAWRAFHAPLG